MIKLGSNVKLNLFKIEKMNVNLNFILKLLAVIAFVLSCFWAYYNPGFEPVIAVIVSISAFIALLVSEKVKGNKSGITQSQSSGSGSQNYQAGGNININQKDND